MQVAQGLLKISDPEMSALPILALGKENASVLDRDVTSTNPKDPTIISTPNADEHTKKSNADNYRKRRTKETKVQGGVPHQQLTVRHREHRDTETDEERAARLRRIAEKQRLRRQQETDEQRATRLKRLSDSQKRRLLRETEEQRLARLRRLSFNQSVRISAETEEERRKRLNRLAQNQILRRERRKLHRIEKTLEACGEEIKPLDLSNNLWDDQNMSLLLNAMTTAILSRRRKD